MTRWEYKMVYFGDANTVEAALNTLGQAGWELICLDPKGWAAILKRPVEKWSKHG